jgi:ring-1,2-phenylacetyl-CoA epoxidase subunit PaaA
MTFPVDKRIAQVAWYPAPDVVPEVCYAVDEVPLSEWNSTTELYELADVIQPWLERHGARKWDFIWSMERHFSEPYGPLPKAKQHFMAGIPELFLRDESALPENAVNYEVGGVLGEQSHLNLVAQDDVEVLARPYEYEADSEMPEEYRLWLGKLFFAHGECMMPYFGEAAKGHVSSFSAIDKFSMEAAPSPESRLRMSNFSNEEYKHTYQFYKLYDAYDPKIPIQIYEREREQFRAYESTKLQPPWVDRGIYNMVADRFGVYQGFEWVQSSYAPLARVSLKVVKDERGHSNMGYMHLREAIQLSGREAREEAQRRIDEYWYPQFMASFGSPTSRNNQGWRKWGLKQHTNDQLRLAFDAEMRAVLASLELETPDLEQATTVGMEWAEALRAKRRAAPALNQ